MISELERIEDLLASHLKSDELHQLTELVSNLNRKDAVWLVERLPVNRAAVLFRFLPKNLALRVFETLDARHQADLLSGLHQQDVITFFEEMDPDDRVSLLDEVPAVVAEDLLKGLSPKERNLTGVVLGYPKDSVGRHMSPEVIALSPQMSAAEAMELVRSKAQNAETIYTLPVISAHKRLLGVVSLRDLIITPDPTPIEQVMTAPIHALASDDAEKTARWFLPLDLLALPIVDKEQRLVGILTVDDAQDIVEYEDTEDAARGGGHEPLRQPYLSTPPIKIMRSRVVWLLVLALSAVLTVHVLDLFETTLSNAVVLALFIPLLTGTGGNTGNQAATTVTRALALGDVETHDALKVAWRELRVGFGLGVVLGSIGFALTSVVYSVPVGLVIGLTLVSVCTMAATVGGLMPILARALGADPAVFSNPFISTFCDATGLIIYFLIAKAILGI